ncbi:RnfABCDGE type electron transport complex subunit D [filamentous cyanobacterium LEGE 11480]|uniref:RnfABCDGE type electron transport complex subunit D n=1 Tax=Romeriopsis navalis LEGE 11480 TaxID=2777977 RepID=A0A928Z4T1_9CYAN|nr:RnfABCDGE type electron transport complex subunit D [Romeriopsis navalis]MBE9030708.1 RnfABCDGE type electron transport complex subunit D [Romeriopsis navalis LEGE 11480]
MTVNTQVDIQLDARLYQIGFLSCFLMLGLLARDWTLQWTHLLTVIGMCLGTQLMALNLVQPAQSWDISMLYSPMITALGLCLLLRVESPWTMAIAGMVAIGSKFVIRVREKHVFNPANAGIIFALCLTPDAWVSPGQWGASLWLVAVFLAAGGLVLRKVGRWDTTAAFLGFYLGLEAWRNFYLGWTWDVWAHRMMNGSLILFALFMITDPCTIPNSRVGRLTWALLIAVLTFVLRNVFFVNTAVFWALFVMAPLTPLFDRVFVADRFNWNQGDDASAVGAELVSELKSIERSVA